MKLTVHTKEKLPETEIAITCSRVTPEIERIIAMLRILDKKLTAKKDGEIFILDANQVLYIETVDKKTFLYTEDAVYETHLRLYELEEQLSDSGFFRAGKSCVIQLKYIKSLKYDIDRRIRVTMENGEKLIVSRQYADELKRRLGVK